MNLLEKIKQAKADSGMSWSPQQVDDMIIGEVLSIDNDVQTEYGKKMVIQINAECITSDGKEQSQGIYNVWERTQLKNKIDSLRPKLQEGDEIAIKYCGIPVGKNYKMFAVEVKRNPFLADIEKGEDDVSSEDENKLSDE